MATRGFNFRNTSGYVTDGTDETYVIDGDEYPTTRDGIDFGWDDELQIQFRDRNSGNDRRLAGLNVTNTNAERTFRVDLEDLNGSGSYDLRAAHGDPNYAVGSTYVQYRDDTTAFLTIDSSTTAANSFLDITNTEYTAANWPGSNSNTSRTFTSQIFRLAAANGTDTTGLVSHIEFEWTAGGSARKVLFVR